MEPGTIAIILVPIILLFCILMNISWCRHCLRINKEWNELCDRQNEAWMRKCNEMNNIIKEMRKREGKLGR